MDGEEEQGKRLNNYAGRRRKFEKADRVRVASMTREVSFRDENLGSLARPRRTRSEGLEAKVALWVVLT